MNMGNIYKIISLSLLCSLGLNVKIHGASQPKSPAELFRYSEKPKKESEELKKKIGHTMSRSQSSPNLLVSQKQSASPSGQPKSGISYVVSQKPSSPAPAMTRSRSFATYDPSFLGRETMAKAAKAYLDNNTLKKVEEKIPLSWDTLKEKEEAIRLGLNQLKENENADINRFAALIRDRINQFSNVKDANMKEQIIYPLLRDLYKSSSKAADRDQWEKAVKMYGAITGENPDMMQKRIIRTLIQYEGN
jgi:hypothetical protein